MDNFIQISYANPIKFFEVGLTQDAAFFTKHFNDYKYNNRLYFWQKQDSNCQIWQTTDIIKLQFTANFSPIIFELVNKYNSTVITLTASQGIANLSVPGSYTYEIACSLAGLQTGCYYIRLTCGSGVSKKVFVSDCQYISSEIIENSLLLGYKNSRYHLGMLFETGIMPQFRVMGSFGQFDFMQKNEQYRNQQWRPSLLNSKVSKQQFVFFGDGYGLADEQIDLLNYIWSCNYVLIDNKQFTPSDGSKFEYVAVDNYAKRGIKLMVEDANNYNSKIVGLPLDPNNRIVTQVLVSRKVFGDLSNQGSTNTVPVININ